MSSAERTLFQRLARFPYAAIEAQAFMRRRRHGTEPFSRVRFADGRTVAHPPGTERSRTLFLAAADLIDIAPNRADRTGRSTGWASQGPG